MINNDVTAYINGLPAPQKEICAQLRSMIMSHYPEWQEEFKWGYPCYYIQGKRICSLGGFKDHCNLELDYGAHLKDPKNILKGVGKNIKHIEIRSVAEIDTAYYLRLLDASLDMVRR